MTLNPSNKKALAKIHQRTRNAMRYVAQPTATPQRPTERQALEAIANMQIWRDTNPAQLAALCIAIAKAAIAEQPDRFLSFDANGNPVLVSVPTDD